MTIGRILLTKQQPAEANSFWCWLGSAPGSPPPNVEIGSLLVVEDEAGTRRIIGMVDSLQHTSATPDFIIDFYGNAYGNPTVTPPTQPAVIRLAKLRVLYREPQEARPPDGRWRVRHGTAQDLTLMAQRIPENHRILAGLIRMGSNEADPNNWMPLYAHSEFLLGAEAAHLNISGISGLATKSSYALFLAYSVLTWARRVGEPVAVVAFNVKREDFLRLHNLPADWAEFDQWVTNWAAPIGGDALSGRTRAMWEQSRNQGIDPLALRAGIRYFTYQGDTSIDRIPLPAENRQLFDYGFQDLGSGAFMAGLFTTEEAEQQVNLLSRYLQEYRTPTGTKTFNGMLADLRTAEVRPQTNNAVLVQGIGNWNVSVVGALRRRLDGFLSPNRAGRVINAGVAMGAPVRFAALQPGSINVVQLYGLSDDAQRLVVNAVIKEIDEGLQSTDSHLRRVLVIADELNKFAPAGRPSPIKEQIIDVVARGRDLRLSLVGAQQFASDVDGQVYGNSTTKVIGYTDLGELSHSIYRELADFKEAIPTLQKGQMLFRHHIYPAPLLMWFPSPIHSMRPQPILQAQNLEENADDDDIDDIPF